MADSLANGLLLWHFHDRYWYPTDDGLHAHIAERPIAGEVLARDVQDIHPGFSTDESQSVMQFVRSRYAHVATVDGAEVYVLR